MLRALRRAEGFALYFAVCNVPARRSELVEEIRRNLPRPILEVTIPPEADDPYPAIAEAAGGGTNSGPAPPDAVIFIYGLEHLIPSDDREQARRTLNRLNWQRSAYKRLERPLVFWVPSYLIPLLTAEAPDFWDWHSGLYEFPLPEAVRGEVLTRLTEGDYWAAWALPVEEKKEQIRLLEGLLDEYRGDDPASLRARKEALRRLADFHYSLGNYEIARKHLREWASIAEKLGDRAELAAAYSNLGAIHWAQGDYGQALEYCQRALKISEEMGNRGSIAKLLGQLGNIFLLRGDLDGAERHYRESLEIKREVGDRRGIAASLHQLGMVYEERGDLDEAERHYRESLEIMREIGDRGGIAASLGQLGNIFLLRGDLDGAERHYRESLEIMREIGDRGGIAASLGQLGVVYERRKDFRKALRLFLEALFIYEELGLPEKEIVRSSLARLSKALGKRRFERMLREAAEEMRSESPEEIRSAYHGGSPLER